jgi:hypothetical protein
MIFAKKRISHTTWLKTAWHVKAANNCISAKTLERMLSTKDRGAWIISQRFRAAMANGNCKHHSDNIKIDETFIRSVKTEGDGNEYVGLNELCWLQRDQRGRRFWAGTNATHTRYFQYQFTSICVRDIVVAGYDVHTNGYDGYNGLPNWCREAILF